MPTYPQVTFGPRRNSVAESASHIHAISGVTGLQTTLDGKQPLDSDLSEIAALLTAAYGRSVLETVSASALRTLAGLIIGTDVQAFNATLAALAGLSLVQGDILYRDASGLQKLAAGTSGYFLKTLGAGVDPAWAPAAIAHRGALVTKAADQTAASYLTATAIAFDAEGYDTDAIHDNVTNNSRLTVPAGVTKVKLLGNVYTSNVNASEDIFIDTRKNSVQSVLGMANNMTRSAIGFARTNVASAVLSVAPGDYFQLFLGTSADLSITVHKDLTWFAMEIVE